MSKCFTVAVYATSRQYGGPEEGGWWYNHSELIRPLRSFKSSDRAYEYCRRFNEKSGSPIGPNFGRRSMYSVIGDDRIEAMVCEDAVPRRLPEERPYYC